MIPRRITVSGFLCYRDEQVIDFDGCDLWVFTGRNGSGKSTIFDAMTFALFGAHRGGKQDAASLINAEANELQVVFDFDLGSDLYRIRRSLPRNGQTEGQLFRFEPDDRGVDRWPAVPEAGSVKALNRWVQENLGLTYDTFTASVLLMQGQAERLLGAQPKHRFEILSGIVDLARYQRLYKGAEQRRQGSENMAEAFRSQLRALPEIAEADVEECTDNLARAKENRDAAEREWKLLLDLEHLARTWKDLADRRGKARGSYGHAEELLADSDAILLDWSRLQELDRVLPALGKALEQRGRLERAEAESRRLEQERLAIDRKLDLMEGLTADNREHLETIVEEIGRDERRKQEILERQAALSRPIQRNAMARKQREEVARLERALASFPDDLEAEIVRLEADHRHRIAWKAALPLLNGLVRHRDGLAEARWLTAEADLAIAAGETEIVRLETALDRCCAESQTATEDESLTRDRLTVAMATFRAATTRLEKFESLRGASTCGHCGQLLTEAHYASEAARLGVESDEASRVCQHASQAHDLAEGRLNVAKAAQDASEKLLLQAREALMRTRRDRLEADRDAQTCCRECDSAYKSLAEPFRSSVAEDTPEDWLSTVFPTAEELAAGQRRTAGIDPLTSTLDVARKRYQELQGNRSRLEQAHQALSAVGWEPDDEAAEPEHITLSAETAVLDRCLKGHEKEKSLAQATLTRLEQLLKEIALRKTENESRGATDRARVESWAEELARARSAIPESWHAAFDFATAAEIDALDEERQDLRDRGVEVQARELPQAQFLLEQARAEIADLDRRIAEIPVEAQRDPDEATRFQAEAEGRRHQACEMYNTCQRSLDALLQGQEQRQALGVQLLEAERRQDVLETLASLLSRNGLQRDLLRDAEQGILECANPILREISGGELELSLLASDDGADHALEMEAIVRTHGQTCTHDVIYLSGSQRFRAAVSLALGIGQFARGGSHRSIGSVIIDEGFGCLDRQGRDEMKEELTKLKGQLRRIILVSHQEEFAEAFNDGYHFEIIDGATVAEPFHR